MLRSFVHSICMNANIHSHLANPPLQHLHPATGRRIVTPMAPVRGRGTGSNPPSRFYRRSVELDPDAADPEEPLPRTQFIKDSARTIISRNDSPDVGFEFSINPYRGCE